MFSLIMDDAQLEKMREIPYWLKRGKRRNSRQREFGSMLMGLCHWKTSKILPHKSQGADYESAEQQNVNSDKEKSKSDNQTPKS
ncbi:DNA helicase INO80-like [Iris pallida]|uniref:DNA helicase INO80-like n=1 Tax=Iris pallida TaxID=29817 RepID=A0AAX6G123_IRIPA|nr:DNA helicase INO80-like [Iris pallida]